MTTPTLPSIPNPPPPNVKRFDAQGRPTTAQVQYEQDDLIWKRAVAAILGSL